MTKDSCARRAVLASACAALLCCVIATPAAARRKQPEPLPPATSGLIDNVNGLTVGKDSQLVRFTGLLIDSTGRVERRLTREEDRPTRLAWRLDGNGRTLIPSFVDAHARMIDSGISLITLDMSGTRSLAEAQTKIAAWLRDNPGRRWILGRGWDASGWGKLPTARDLDAVTGDTPAWLISADGRTGWANSATLRLAGIKPGATAGAFSGTDRQRLEQSVPSPSPKDRDVALDRAQRMFISRGISTVADMGTTIDDWQAFRRAGDRGALRLRIAGYADGVAQMVTIAGPSPSPWLYDGKLRLGGVRIAIPATAMDSTRLRNQASRAAMDGFQIAFAPDGPTAQREAEAAIAELRETYTGDRRWRIETDDDDTSFARLARLAAMDGGDIAHALAALTSRSAHTLFAEDQIGALEPGQWADFLIVDRDIAAAASDIAATKLLEHWIAGRRAWSSTDAK